jgi:hypothetical protein
MTLFFMPCATCRSGTIDSPCGIKHAIISLDFQRVFCYGRTN